MPRTDSQTVRQILTAHGIDTSADRYETGPLDIHLKTAHKLVTRELEPAAAGADDALEDTEAYLAASYAADSTGADSGAGAISSVQQGSRQISFDTEDLEGTAAQLFATARRFDPSNRLGELAKPTATVSVPDVRGGRH
jgi:hypothetical protein